MIWHRFLLASCATMGKVFHGGGGFLTVGGWWVLRLCGGGDGECCVCAASSKSNLTQQQETHHGPSSSKALSGHRPELWKQLQSRTFRFTFKTFCTLFDLFEVIPGNLLCFRKTADAACMTSKIDATCMIESHLKLVSRSLCSSLTLKRVCSSTALLSPEVPDVSAKSLSSISLIWKMEQENNNWQPPTWEIRTALRKSFVFSAPSGKQEEYLQFTMSTSISPKKFSDCDVNRNLEWKYVTGKTTFLEKTNIPLKSKFFLNAKRLF